MALAAGRAADWARVRLRTNPALHYQGPCLVADGHKADSTAAINKLDIGFAPLDTPLADTVNWLHEAGHITGRPETSSRSGSCARRTTSARPPITPVARPERALVHALTRHTKTFFDPAIDVALPVSGKRIRSDAMMPRIITRNDRHQTHPAASGVRQSG